MERAPSHVPLRRMGAADKFGELGTADELLEMHGLKSRNIVEVTRELIAAR